MAKSNKERQDKYQETMRNRGFAPITTWVHLDDKANILRYADQLRKRRTP